ncbi:MAG: hypothetical protein WEE51_01410, partial [Pirellulaceae bacterium]
PTLLEAWLRRNLEVATVAKTVGELWVGYAPGAKRLSTSPTLLEAWLRRNLEVATVAKTVGELQEKVVKWNCVQRVRSPEKPLAGGD